MKSRYVILISGLSKYTRSSDIRYECERFGTVMGVERDIKQREALVEFKHSADAADAYDELDGIRVDDRTWKVHRATKEDFEFFRWKWFEDDDDGDVRDDYRYDDKKRDDAVSTRRGHSEDATGSPSPDDKKYSGRASPLREEYD